MWDDQLRDLAAEHHCIAVDLPAHGSSRGVPWVDLADTASWVAEVIDHDVGGPAHDVGLSLGGYVALTLLAEHPVFAAMVRSWTQQGSLPYGLQRPAERGPRRAE